MKIGLDVHGVIDEMPGFINLINSLLIKDNINNDTNHEIHIITGLTHKDFLKTPAVDGIEYTHFYSITDDLMNKESYTLDIYGRPRFDCYAWNIAKAEYCRKNEIDIMFDDSEIYGKYFQTPYFQVRRTK